MVDAAIERIAQEQEVARTSSDPTTDPGHALAVSPVEDAGTALASAGSARRAAARLRWKGLDVSEEFRRYAERVARGEDLPPFKGKILAEPDPAFPWDPATQRRAESRARTRQLGLWSGVALFLAASISVLVMQVSKQPDASRRAAADALSSVVLSNQPAPATPEGAAADPRQPSSEDPAPQVARAALEKLENVAPSEEAPGVTGPEMNARAALAEPAGESAPTSPASAPAPAPPAAHAPASATTPSRSSAVASASPAPAAAPSAGAATSAGVYVTTHPVKPGVEEASSGVGAIIRTPPGALGGPVSPADGTSGAAATAAPPGAGDAPTAADSAVAHADPKKEPGREASAMGALLVETPSF